MDSGADLLIAQFPDSVILSLVSAILLAGLASTWFIIEGEVRAWTQRRERERDLKRAKERKSPYKSAPDRTNRPK